MTRTYEEVTAQRTRYADLVHESKRAIMRASLSSEMHMLAQQLERIAEGDRRSRDFTVSALYTAVVQTVASFPAYRTYIRADGSREPNDDHFVARAIRDAKRRTPELNSSVFDFLREVLLLHGGQPPDPARARFAMRFQQLTGPVMAKGVEATAFYRYLRLASLNEVGASPARFGTSVAEFHAQNADRLARWPLSMTATSTHDTKRGEDVRARLAVLTEIPDEWREQSLAWTELAKAHATTIGGAEDGEEERLPTRNDEYLFFQTAVGLPDPDPERLVAYMAKAAKESKDKTSWVNPDEAYEAALTKLVRGMLADATFREQLARLHARIAVAGVLRKQNAQLFQKGDYVPLAASHADGCASENIVAFTRSHEGRTILCVVPRLALHIARGPSFALGAAWDDHRLTGVPSGTWRNAFTDEVVHTDGGDVRLAQVFAAFPVALLEKRDREAAS